MVPQEFFKGSIRGFTGRFKAVWGGGGRVIGIRYRCEGLQSLDFTGFFSGLTRGLKGLHVGC